MPDIRKLLSQGKSSAEVIALGYNPPTVYQMQRQLRQQPNGKEPDRVRDQAREGELFHEATEAGREFFRLAGDSDPTDALRIQLDEARKRSRN